MKKPTTMVMVGWVALAGGVGAVLREMVLWASGDLPMLGLLTVNLLGSFGLGIAFARLEPRAPRLIDAEVVLSELPDLPGRRHILSAVIAIGGLGAFTTYSSLALRAVALADRDQWTAAISLMAGSLIGGVILVGLGAIVGHRWRTRRHP